MSQSSHQLGALGHPGGLAWDLPQLAYVLPNPGPQMECTRRKCSREGMGQAWKAMPGDDQSLGD